jgi:hypothetical protein
MNFMDKLYKKFGKYAVYNLQKYLIFAYTFGVLLNLLQLDVSGLLGFSMDAILRGQVWRLVTWVFCADGSSIISLLFIYCVYSMAQGFEQMVGTFRMNVYLIGGMILNLLGAILVYVLTFFLLGQGVSVNLTNYEMLFTLFMAFALCMPEATVYLYFLIPIKMKWMFFIYIAGLIYQFYTYYSIGSAYGVGMGILFVIVNGSQVIFSLLNLFLFFRMSKLRLNRKQKKTQTEFRKQMASVPKTPVSGARHKCAICGRTELDNPDLTFRYCSKCTGNKEYCQDHLFTHTHN